MCSFAIGNFGNYFRFLGNIFINSDVKTSDNSQYRFYFGYPSPADQLYYLIAKDIQSSSNSPTNIITPIDNFNMGLLFKDAIIDFSERTKAVGAFSLDINYNGHEPVILDARKTYGVRIRLVPINKG